MRFLFALPVWGRHHTHAFLRAGLPSQLTPRNLHALTAEDRRESEYCFYTTGEAETRIREHPVFAALADILPVRFVRVDESVRTKASFQAFMAAQKQAVGQAYAADAAIFFLQPDLVWSDGSLGRAADLIRQGYDAVVCPSLRVVAEDFLQVLEAGGLEFPAAPRHLVKVALSCLHPQMRTWFADSDYFDRSASYLLSPVPGAGIAAFCYILHPVAIKPAVHVDDFQIFDQDFVLHSCPRQDTIFYPRSSDEMVFVDLTRRARFGVEPVSHRFDASEFAWYAEWQFNQHHRAFAREPTLIHHRDVDERLWRPVLEAGRETVGRIEQSLRRSDWRLLWSDRRTLRVRLRHRYRYVSARFRFNWRMYDDLGGRVGPDWHDLYEPAGLADRLKLMILWFEETGGDRVRRVVRLARGGTGRLFRRSRKLGRRGMRHLTRHLRILARRAAKRSYKLPGQARRYRTRAAADGRRLLRPVLFGLKRAQLFVAAARRRLDELKQR